MAILRTRATSLVGMISDRLPSHEWTEAYALLMRQLADPDKVVRLTAISSLGSMLSGVSMHRKRVEEFLEERDEERAQIAAEAAASRVTEEETGMQEAYQAAARALSEGSGARGLTEAQKSLERRVTRLIEVVNDSAEEMLSSCFGALESISEPVSIASVLTLVSLLIDILGEKVREHVGVFAAAVPRAWLAARQRAERPGQRQQQSDDDYMYATIGLTRVYGTLTTLLTHLVARLGSSALASEELRPVLLQLLGHILTAKREEDENMQYLKDEAFALFETVQLVSGPPVLETLLPLLPHVVSSVDLDSPGPALAVIDGFLALGRTDLVAPHIPHLVTAMQSSLYELRDRLVVPEDETPEQKRDRPPRGLSETNVKDVIGICAVIDQLLVYHHRTKSNEMKGDITGKSIEPPQELTGLLHAMSQLLNAVYRMGNPLVKRLVGGLVETLSRALYLYPTALNRLSPSQGRSGQLLTPLINLGTKIGIEEMLGGLLGAFGPGLSVLFGPRHYQKMQGGTPDARRRRHAVVLGIASAVCGGKWDFGEELPLLKRVFMLGFRVCQEKNEFTEDLKGDEAEAMSPEFPRREGYGGPDDTRLRQIRRRKIATTQHDPLFKEDAQDALRRMAAYVLNKMSWTEELLCDAFGWTGTVRAKMLSRLMKGERVVDPSSLKERMALNPHPHPHGRRISFHPFFGGVGSGGLGGTYEVRIPVSFGHGPPSEA